MTAWLSGRPVAASSTKLVSLQRRNPPDPPWAVEVGSASMTAARPASAAVLKNRLANQRSRAMFREQLHEKGVRLPAIQDDGRLDSLFHCLHGGFKLGNHPPFCSAVCDQG